MGLSDISSDYYYLAPHKHGPERHLETVKEVIADDDYSGAP